MTLLNRTLAPAQSKTESLRLFPVIIVVLVAVVAIALLQVFQTSRATTANFAIQRLEQERLQLDAEVRGLEAEVGELSSLARISSEAERMGLEPAQSRQTVVVNVPLTGGNGQRLPTRFAPSEAEVDERSSSWWQRLLDVLRLN